MDKTNCKAGALLRSLEELRRDFHVPAAKWPDMRLGATNHPPAAPGHEAGARVLIEWIRGRKLLVSWLAPSDPRAQFSKPTVDDLLLLDDAARAFVGLARDAGHVARAVLPCDDCAGDGAPLWIEALFRFAWTWQQGTPLRAVRFVDFEGHEMRHIMAGNSTRAESPHDPLPVGLWYSRLEPDPFRASVALVDLLLGGLAAEDTDPGLWVLVGEARQAFGFKTDKQFDVWLTKHRVPWRRPRTKDGKENPHRREVNVLAVFRGVKADAAIANDPVRTSRIQQYRDKLRLDKDLEDSALNAIMGK